MRIGRKALVVVLIIVALLAAGGAMPLLEVVVDTKGVGNYFRGVRGGSTDNGGGDLLDTDAYVTSWTGGGTSEKIVIQGHYYCSGAFDPEFIRYWYVVKFEVNNPEMLVNGIKDTTFQSGYYENPPVNTGQWLPMQAITLTLTNPCMGKVTAELWGHIHYYTPLPQGEDVVLASDQAYLKSGVGRVQVQTDVVEENTEVSIHVETGYASSAKSGVSQEGWTLDIYNPAGTSVYSKDVADNFDGPINWLVPVGSYSTAWSNVFKVTLKNVLLNQDDDFFFTVGVGMIDDIPNKPSFKLITGSEPFTKGEKITVRVYAEKTVNPITGFHIWVSYETSAGATVEYVYYDTWYPAYAESDGKTFFCDVSYTFPESGFARLEASAVDSLVLNSGISELSFTVQGILDVDGGDDDDESTTDWGIVILGLFLILAALFVWWKAPLPQLYKIIVCLALVGVALYVLWPILGG